MRKVTFTNTTHGTQAVATAKHNGYNYFLTRAQAKRIRTQLYVSSCKCSHDVLGTDGTQVFYRAYENDDGTVDLEFRE